MQERSDDGGARAMRLVQQRVQMGQQLVAGQQGLPHQMPQVVRPVGRPRVLILQEEEMVVSLASVSEFCDPPTVLFRPTN